MLVRHSVNAFILIDANPFDRFAAGHLPDHLITLANDRLADPVCCINVGALDRTVWIKLCPVGGLDCPSGLDHVVWFVVCIVDYGATGVNTPSCRTTPQASHPSHRGQCLRHPMRGHRRSSCRTPADGGSVWRTRCARRFVPYGRGALRC